MYLSVPGNLKTSTNINTKSLHIGMSQLNFLKEKKIGGWEERKRKSSKKFQKEIYYIKGNKYN